MIYSDAGAALRALASGAAGRGVLLDGLLGAWLEYSLAERQCEEVAEQHLLLVFWA